MPQVQSGLGASCSPSTKPSGTQSARIGRRRGQTTSRAMAPSRSRPESPSTMSDQVADPVDGAGQERRRGAVGSPEGVGCDRHPWSSRRLRPRPDTRATHARARPAERLDTRGTNIPPPGRRSAFVDGPVRKRAPAPDPHISGAFHVARFRCKDDDELKRLDDEALLLYIAAARRAGEPDCAQRGLAIIVSRYEGDVKRRVRAKVRPADVEDVTQEAIVSAIFSSLEGHSIGEFRKWLNQIVSRRIADYYKRKRTRDHRAPRGARGERRDLGRGRPGRGRDRRRRGSRAGG